MSNYKIIEVKKGDEWWSTFCDFPKSIYPNESPRFLLGFDSVEEHLLGKYILLVGDEVLGRFALYQNDKLHYQQQSTVSMGSYECVDDKSLSEVMILEARALAKNYGAHWLIGPMEGSTWNSYRFSLENKEPFFMEPFHHHYYIKQWLSAGFQEIAHYHSSIANITLWDDDKYTALLEHYQLRGASFRTINKDVFQNELKAIAKLCNVAFADNFLFSQMSPSSFVSKNVGMADKILPELVWLVENEKKELEAFVFAIPNYYDAKRESIIIKTIAANPGTSFKGVGSLLAEIVNRQAKKMGFNKAIHAFMKDDNVSQAMSFKNEGVHFQEYALYALPV